MNNKNKKHTPCMKLHLLIFSFCEWAPSSDDPIGSSMTLFPVAFCIERVTGMLPPSRVKSGSKPNTMKGKNIKR